MISYIENLTTFWLIAGLLLLLIELATPGLFFFVSFAFGTLFGVLAAAIGFRFIIQCWIMLTVSLIQFWSMRRYLAHINNGRRIQTNSHRLVGKKGVALTALDDHTVGQVKVGGEQWGAVAASPKKIKPDAKVIVRRISGNKLIVERSD